VLDRRYASEDPQTIEHHVDHPLPAICIGQLLAVQSIYIIVLMVVAELKWIGVTVVVVSWVAFGIACWHSKASATAQGSEGEGEVRLHRKPSVHFSTDNPTFELTERLLPPVDGDEDDA
jgi:hypothetical protein